MIFESLCSLPQVFVVFCRISSPLRTIAASKSWWIQKSWIWVAVRHEVFGQRNHWQKPPNPRVSRFSPAAWGNSSSIMLPPILVFCSFRRGRDCKGMYLLMHLVPSAKRNWIQFILMVLLMLSLNTKHWSTSTQTAIPLLQVPKYRLDLSLIIVVSIPIPRLRSVIPCHTINGHDPFRCAAGRWSQISPMFLFARVVTIVPKRLPLHMPNQRPVFFRLQVQLSSVFFFLRGINLYVWGEIMLTPGPNFWYSNVRLI